MLKKLVNTLNKDQADIYKEMLVKNKLQICLPTGVGKGYLMRVDILRRILGDENVLAIASHRLILNTQHTDDIIDSLTDIISDVRFIFVGSDNYDINKHQSNTKMVKNLIKSGTSFDELSLNTLSTKELKKYVDKYKEDGKKVIIVTTYHSLDKLSSIDIDTLYCDEAHTLATEKEGDFKSNFESINAKNVYFFTATPKDCSDENDSDSFLMSNEDIFGERIGMTIKDAITKGYITNPMIHIAIPEKYDHEDMDNLTNKVKFITDSYKVHSDKVKEKSSSPDSIEAKMLIKCESVDEMWALYERLIGVLDGVKVYAGASRKGTDGSSYEVDGEKLTKTDHLNSLRDLKNTDKAIVLHVDTLSEGVNVKGFTGVMFLTDNSPTIIKLLQNVGRGTRVIDVDRANFTKGLINTDDYKGWVKPNTYIILPIFNPESESSQDYLSKTIKKLKFDDSIARYIISIGSDLGKGNKNDVDDMIDSKMKDVKKSLVDKIEHRIEEMERLEKDIAEQERLKRLKGFDFLKRIKNLITK
jgi:hypothetical protein